MKSQNNKHKTINYKKYIWAISILLAVLILLNVMFRVSPTFSTNYCNTIYASVSKIFGAFYGLFPFSVIEIIIMLCCAGVLYCIVRLIILIVKYHHRDNIHLFTYKLKRYLLNLVCIVLSALIILTLNDVSLYNRLSFADAAAIKVKERSAKDLVKAFEIIRDDLNSTSKLVSRDRDGIFQIVDTDIKTDAPEAMTNLKEYFPFMPSYYPKPKAILNSRLMSHTRTEGFYSPYTLEANYNKDMPDSDILHTVCHELAHLAGYIHEDEANFIGYLACIKDGSPEFVYSGSLAVISYFLDELHKNVSTEKYTELLSSLDENVRKDIVYSSKYWSQFNTSIAKVSGKVNNAFIKSNGDREGERRYCMVVDLILSYYLE